MFNILILLFCFCGNAFADRLSGSIFDEGIIIKIDKCEKLLTLTGVSISIRTVNSGVLRGNITSHTELLKANNTIGKCRDLENDQVVVVGYAEGNDTGELLKESIIIDSIIYK